MGIRVEILDPDDVSGAFLDVQRSLYSQEVQKTFQLSKPVAENLRYLMVAYDGEAPVGRLALYRNSDHPKGMWTFGAYECADSQDTAETMLQAAKELVLKHGGRELIGPMENSTWNNYRLATKPLEDPFVTEMYHHPYYASQLLDNGFQAKWDYVSMLDDQMHVDPAMLNKLHDHFKSMELLVRPIDMDNLRDELINVAVLSNKAFASNLLFSPIDPELFAEKYLAVAELIVPENVLLAEQNGKLVGLQFGITDVYNPTRFIIKTLARDPDPQYRGLGRYLSDLIIQQAAERGTKQIIHAFMIVDNHSIVLSENHKTNVLREYQLFSVEL